jgi:hypothetical protein
MNGRPVLAAIVFALAVLAAGSPARAQPEIAWRLENPFRFFADPASTELHRQAFEELSEAERRSPVTSLERALSARFPKGWAESIFRETCWDSARNQYVCAANPDYLAPKSHRVLAEVKGLEAAGQPPGQRCEWRVTPLQGKRSAVPKVMTTPCADAVLLEVPYPGGLRVSVRTEGPPLAEADISVKDIFVVGLGDSFGSGEGNPDDPVAFSRERSLDYGKGPRGTDLKGYPARVGSWVKIGDEAFLDNNARWHDQACHRSLYSHQLRVALQLAIEDPHRAVTYAGYACSGAEVIDGLFLIYRGNEWVPNPPARSQISYAAAAQCGPADAPLEQIGLTYDMSGELPMLQQLLIHKCPKARARKIDLLLLSIGGNDIGFSRLVANAVLSDQSTLKWLGGWMGHVHGMKEAKPALSQLRVRFRALNRAFHNILHIPWDEYDRIVLTAYPPIALLEDGRSVCPDDKGGMSVYPDFALVLERANESELMAAELQALMAKAARDFRWSFAEAHRPLFNGHGICAGSISEGVRPDDDLRLPIKADGAEWRPYNPADYRPYASRARWFRTPNDAYLTGNFHMSALVANQAQKFKSLAWFQLVLASTYSGAFHPTAEGQAVIADSVLETARKVLEKYDRRS